MNDPAEPVDSLLACLESWEAVDEDDKPLTAVMSPPLDLTSMSEGALAEYHRLPRDFAEFLARSNGLDLGVLELLPFANQTSPWTMDIRIVHNWGNGDHDGIVISGEGLPFQAGNIVHCKVSGNEFGLVSESFAAWIESVLGEISEIGTLMHPMDYVVRSKQSRWYLSTRPESTPSYRVIEEHRGLYQELTLHILGGVSSDYDEAVRAGKAEATLHTNGRLASYVPLRRGKYHGLYTTWYETGKMSSECTYVKGTLHGPSRNYSPDGRLLREGEYRKNRNWDGMFCEIVDSQDYIVTYCKGKEVDRRPARGEE